MQAIGLYFQAHQPRRLRGYRASDIGRRIDYFADERNRAYFEGIARRSYVPVVRMLETTGHRHSGLRWTLGGSGLVLEALARDYPDVVAAMRRALRGRRLEVLGETFYHSLASVCDLDEFVAQVQLHRALVERTLGASPTVLRNTELLYKDELAPVAKALGFRGLMVEGTKRVLGEACAGSLFVAASEPSIGLLCRHTGLSDDIGFRFLTALGPGAALTADAWCSWVKNAPGEVAWIGIDMETVGEHLGAKTGIFAFFETLPRVAKSHGLAFVLPSEVLAGGAHGALSSPAWSSWADGTKDLGAWLGNNLQRSAHRSLYRALRQVVGEGDAGRLGTWRLLSTSDHFYYMSTRDGDDGEVHAHFNPFRSPYDAYIAYMNVLTDLRLRSGDPTVEGFRVREEVAYGGGL